MSLLALVALLALLLASHVRAGAALLGSSDESDYEEDDMSARAFTSVEAKYHSTQQLVTPGATVREFRRGLALLEEISGGQNGQVGRLAADAMADLAYLYLFGSHGKNAITQSPGKSFHLANQSAHHGSPKGRHLMAFLLRAGIGLPGVPGMVDTESASWSLELLAAEQNYLPAMLSVAYRHLYHHGDCDSALRLYRAAANAAVARVEATFFGDYSSLRALSPQPDELGDDLVAREARDAETVEYWLFHAERKDARALFEVGRMHQLGLWGASRDLPQAVEYYRRAAAAGHAGAQGELGRLLTIGHGVELNLAQALKLLRQAVDSQPKQAGGGGGGIDGPGASASAGAGAGTGVGQSEGTGIGASAGMGGASAGGAAADGDGTLPLPLADSSRPNEGSAVAAATLGSLLKRRIFESDDTELGSRYLRQAASAGSLDAEWELGQAELRDGRVDAALQHFQRAEKRDHVRSMLALAQQYEMTGGLPSGKLTLASAWVGGAAARQAAASAAASAAGAAPASSKPTSAQDQQTCRTVAKLYKRVAEVGPWLDAPYGPRQAMRELRAGRESEALLMYMLAAGEGYEIPHFNAAWLLLRNKGTGSSGVSGSAIASSAAALKHRQHATALQLLQALSAMNPAHAWAALFEGDLHLRGGRAVTRNVTAAAQCYERSAAGGNVLAMERLAVQLMHGTGLRQDDQRAQQLIRLALARVGQEGSGLRGVAALVKQAELFYRLALMSVTGLLRSFLSGKWLFHIVRLLSRKKEPTAAVAADADEAKAEAEADLLPPVFDEASAPDAGAGVGVGIGPNSGARETTPPVGVKANPGAPPKRKSLLHLLHQSREAAVPSSEERRVSE